MARCLFSSDAGSNAQLSIKFDSHRNSKLDSARTRNSHFRTVQESKKASPRLPNLIPEDLNVPLDVL